MQEKGDLNEPREGDGDHCASHDRRGEEEMSVSFTLTRTLKRELLAEVRRSWEGGNPLAIEEVLPRWPSNPSSDPDVASLLFEDYLQRANQGEPPTVDNYEQQFPEHKNSLANLLRQNDLLRSLGTCPSSDQHLRLPELGEELFGFRLRHELGRGAFARVYLAEQQDLAGRPVVLKVSGIEGTEPQLLAQLQHTHIVPIFSIHENARAGLRALCMPYFGGASLSQALNRLWEKSSRPQRGEELLKALDEVAAPAPADLAAGERGPRTVLGRFGYVESVAWIVARLAEGLQHAHQRGVLHRDVKPSNILLGADGQPMLLDFNLAQDQRDSAAQATLGGTIAYMSPEHLRALATRDPALAHTIDQRADIYSLGMVLYEMLAGRSPFEQSASYTPLPVLVEAMALERSRGTPSLRQVRPDVPWSLESIVRHCLAPDPGQRYQQAEHLAEDLRRFLADQPLRHAPEPSRVERVRKWMRRHPRLTSSGAVCSAAVLLLLAVGLALMIVRARLAATSVKLQVAQDRQRRDTFEEKRVRTLFLLNTSSELRDHLTEGLAECQNALGLYGVLDQPDWQDRPEWRRLPEEDRQQLAGDVRELLLLLAGARARLAPRDKGTLGQALTLLDHAARIPGVLPCRALWVDRAAYRAQLGDRDGAAQALQQAGQTAPAGARDYYLLAMTFARERRYAEAVRHLDEALRLDPRDYWSWSQRGLCHHERGDEVLAVGDFGACIGLQPKFAWGYFNRACALARCGRKEEALADYTEALSRDPDLLSAYVNRGMLQLELGRFEPALADFQSAAERGRDDASFHSGRGAALERLGRHEEADAAFRAATRRPAELAPEVRARFLCAQGFALAARDPVRARAAFDEVLADNPTHPQALYGRAMLYDWQGRSEEAIRFFDRVLEASPDFVEAQRFRAVAQARLGNFGHAAQDINACLQREPHSGATLYAAACVAALGVRQFDASAAQQAESQALRFLKQAFAHGYGSDRAEADKDLDGIRQLPAFRELLKSIRPDSRTGERR